VRCPHKCVHDSAFKDKRHKQSAGIGALPLHCLQDAPSVQRAGREQRDQPLRVGMPALANPAKSPVDRFVAHSSRAQHSQNIPPLDLLAAVHNHGP
jgi:hypothetical protein